MMQRGRPAKMRPCWLAVVASALLSVTVWAQAPRSPRIAYTHAVVQNTEVYVMDTDGGNPRNLTEFLGRDFDPVWSPDGRRIAFVSVRDGLGGVRTMNADGGDVRSFAVAPEVADNDLRPGEPAWSPLGDTIAYVVDDGRGVNVHVQDVRGGRPDRGLAILPRTATRTGRPMAPKSSSSRSETGSRAST